MAKRRQYTVRSYKISDFNKKGELKGQGREINLAENQVCELILALKNRKYIEDTENYIPELSFVDISNASKERIEYINRNGIIIDGKKQYRLVRGSSMARNGTSTFIDEDLHKQVIDLISLGKYDGIDEIIISKLESYLGLAFSTTIFIDAVPKNICVVDDSIFDTVIEDYVKGIKDGKLVEGKFPVKVNLLDGMGLHTPQWGKQVARSLKIKDTPVAYQIRLLPSIKGMSYEIDFKEFYKEKGITYITDKWGKEWNINELDAIWSTSMFKLHKQFKSWQEFIDLRNKYYTPLGQNKIGISSWSGDVVEKSKMTYQYLQALDLDENDLIELSQYTKDIIERVYEKDIHYTLIYLGLMADADKEDMMATKVHYALSKNPEMINDPYVRNFLRRQLKKSIDDIKMGRFYIDGAYYFTCQDPILMLEIIAGLEPKGCLQADEFYMAGETGQRAFFRSPLTHSSEVKKAMLVNNELADKWLSRYQNILVMNGKDITPEQISGSDFDGDRYFITDNQKIINAVMTELKGKDEHGNIYTKPNYAVVDIDEQRNRELASESKLNIDNIIKFDINSTNNKIGQITNIATYLTTYAQAHGKMANYDDRLVYLRLLQGQEIDFVKHGVRLLKMPKEYEKIRKYKPYFLQRYKYGRDGFYQKYVYHAPMNVLCRHIERWERETFIWKRWQDYDVDTTSLIMNKDVLNENREETKRVYQELKHIYEDFKEGTSQLYLADFEDEDVALEAYSTFYDSYHYKVNQISDNKELLSSIAVYLTYVEDKRDDKTKSYQFPWTCCWEGMAITIDRTAPKSVTMPIKDIPPNLDAEMIEYLGDVYYLTEALNSVTAYDFIDVQYKKQIEKELKEQRHNFTYETVLYGFNELSVDEVVDIINNEELRLGNRTYKGKQYASIFAGDKYIASIKDKTDEFIDPEMGYVDLKTMRGNVDIEIIEIHNRSIKVKMKIFDDCSSVRAV